jgi:hypothetical protein
MLKKLTLINRVGKLQLEDSMCRHCETPERKENGPHFIFLPIPFGEVEASLRLHRALKAGSDVGALAEAQYHGHGKVARIIGEIK